MDTYAEIREGAAKKLSCSTRGRPPHRSRSATSSGRCRSRSSRASDGKWAFDTYAGLEEIINRRVGENELQAIETMRAYVEAQRGICRRRTATTTACWNMPRS